MVGHEISATGWAKKYTGYWAAHGLEMHLLNRLGHKVNWPGPNWDRHLEFGLVILRAVSTSESPISVGLVIGTVRVAVKISCKLDLHFSTKSQQP